MIQMIVVLFVVAGSHVWGQSCATPWADGNGYPGGTQLSYNNVNYSTCLWTNSGIHPGANVEGGGIGPSCGWNGALNVTVNWIEIGPCVGGVAISSVQVSSSQTTSSSSAANSSVAVISSAQVSSSSQTSSESNSSQNISSSDDTPINVNFNRNVVKRCQVSGTESGNVQACLDPSSLEGAIINVPSNVTRIEKDGLSICQIVSDEVLPTVVFFILDHSGSMANTNDPLRIADDAFRDAVDQLQSLDSRAHAGYIAFSSGIKNESYTAPGLLDNTYINTLKGRINDSYGGGTAPSTALARANQNLLDSKYDGYNRAIVFLGDGVFNESRNTIKSAVKDGVPVHAIYLNNNPGSTGQSLKDMVNDAPDGSFNRIYTAADILPIMESVIDNIIEIQAPSSVTITNEDLNISGISDISSMTQQADSSWKLPLDIDIPLQPGNNNISLVTQYSSNMGLNQDVPVNFQINLVPVTINDDIPIPGTVFSSKCVEWARIELQDPLTDTQKEYIDQESESIQIYYQSLEVDGQGDSIEVLVTSSTHMDTLTIHALRFDSADGVHKYKALIPINWDLVAASPHDGFLDLSSVDSIQAQWNHPVDTRDNALTEAFVFWKLPKLQHSKLFDNDGNGKLDSISFKFQSRIIQPALKYLEFELPWLSDSNTYETLSSINWKIQVDPKDSLKAYVNLDDNQIGYLTGLQDSLGALRLRHNYPNESNHVDTNFINLDVKDMMSPVLYRAKALVGKSENMPSTLFLYLSEPLSETLLREHLHLTFKNQKQREFDFDLSQVDIDIEDKNIAILHGGDFGERFRFLPKDSIRLAPGLVSDSFANLSREDRPLIPIILELAPQIEIQKFNEFIASEYLEKPRHKLEVFDINTDIDGKMKYRGKISAGFGPFTGNRLDTTKTIENTKWSWEVQVFDNIGQFIAKFNGVLRCDDEAFKSNGSNSCMDSEGLQLLFTWNNKTRENRLVASGVYILRIRVSGQDDYVTQVGVRRLEEN